MTFTRNHLLNLLRGSMLATSLLSLAILVSWNFKPGWIDQLETRIIERHVSPHQKRLEQAESYIEKMDLDNAVRVLESSRAALSFVRKGDRLAPERRTTLKLLSGLLARMGHKQQAYAVVDEWEEFDGRDINARLQRVRLDPVGEADTARQLAQQFPSLETQLRDVLVPPSLQPGPAMLRQAVGTLLTPPTGAWQIFWDTGQGFNERQSMRLPLIETDTGQVELQMQITEVSKRVRIDGPSRQPLLLIDPELKISSGNRHFTINLSNRKGSRDVRQLAPRVLELRGADPHQPISLPGWLQQAPHMDIHLQTRVMAAPTIEQLDLLMSSTGGDLVREYADQFSPGEIELLMRIRSLLTTEVTENLPQAHHSLSDGPGT